MIAFAFIGCGIVFLLGLFCLFLAAGGIWTSGTFGGGTEWLPVVVFGSIGFGLIWLAVKFSPLTISLATT